MKQLTLILAIIFGILLNVDAKTYTYRTVQSGNWSDASTWENGKVPPYTISWASLPTGNKNVIISAGDSVSVSKAINVNSGGSLDVQGILYATEPVKIMAGGDLNVSGNFYMTKRLETAWTGDITVTTTGYIGVSGNISVAAGANFTNNGTIVSTENDTYATGGVWGTIGGSGQVLFNAPSAIPKPSGLLPIELKSFSAYMQNGIANFKWVTASEENNDYFNIEQSTNLKEWESVVTKQGAGNSYSEITYTAQSHVKNKMGIYYFRLKQTDYDGKYTYSKIVSATNNINNDIPKAVVINGEVNITNKYDRLQIFNLQGNLVASYSDTYTISNLPTNTVLLFIFDNKYKQKIVFHF